MQYRLMCAIGLLLALLVGTPALAQPSRCTQHTVVGTYALAVQGSTLVTQPGSTQAIGLPFASLSIVSIDSTGAMSGVGYGSFAGQVAHGPVGGSIQVNPDCTAIVRTSAGTTSTDVILDGGDEIVGLMFEFPMGKPVAMGTARRIARAPQRATTEWNRGPSLNGTYAAQYQGSYMMSTPGAPQPIPVPALMLALVSIDHQGHLTGSGTISLAGNAMPFEIAGGEVEVNADCTATVGMSVRSASLADEGKSWMVILGEGDELLAIQIESQTAAPVVAGTWKRISDRSSDDGRQHRDRRP
jgi:hypothetical protein